MVALNIQETNAEKQNTGPSVGNSFSPFHTPLEYFQGHVLLWRTWFSLNPKTAAYNEFNVTIIFKKFYLKKKTPQRTQE